MQTESQELKSRIEARRKELEADIERAKADTNRELRDRADEAQSELEKLQQTLKSGWDNMTEEVAGKLNRWLADSKKD